MALIAAAPGPAAAPRPPVHVDADEVQDQYKERRAVFLGNPLVRLTREDAVLTCRKLVTDNDEQGKLRRAVCTGDVKLTRGTKLATCQMATYDDATSRVVCVGNPVLKDWRFRNALNYAVDRQALSEIAYIGKATLGTTILPPGMWSDPDYQLPGWGSLTRPPGLRFPPRTGIFLIRRQGAGSRPGDTT